MSGTNVKILLVDDEEGLVEIYSEVLQGYANFVCTAANGAEALEVIFREKDIDIVITDLKMPIMDGLELLRQIGIKYPHIVTIIVSGNRDYESMSKAIEYGVHDFLDKPLRLDIFGHKIVNTIKMVVQNRKRNRMLEYLLMTITNQSMADFYNLDIEKQGKILDAVQEIISARIVKSEVDCG